MLLVAVIYSYCLRFRYLFFICNLFLCLFVLANKANAKLPTITLAGPPALVSFPLIHMLESKALSDFAVEVKFITWSNPDQLRALVLGSQADFIAMPTNLAANLYNKNIKLNLVNVSNWGILWMISRNSTFTTLADFKGQEIAIPFRADMPDIIFNILAEKEGLNPQQDFKIRYVANPIEGMQLLVKRKIDHALLAEPAISMALMRTKSLPLSLVAPNLYRSVNLQQEWGRLFKVKPQIPQAGVAVVGDTINNKQLIAKFEKIYANSMQWCLNHADDCASMVVKHFKLLTHDATVMAINNWINVYHNANDAKFDLEQFFSLLLERNSALIGGKLPNNDFYFNDLNISD